MGRPKNFSREQVLKKAMPLFWDRGFTDTGLHDLERVTGVNKSGLYAEFKNKEDLFLEVLRYYFASRADRDLLRVEPLGWANIEKFMKARISANRKNRGCLSVNTMRESNQLPEEAIAIMAEGRAKLKILYAKNIAAEKTKLSTDALVEIVSTFFSGICIEENLKGGKAPALRKVSNFISVVRGL